MLRSALIAPNVRNFGYAVFLSISATSIWGGVFPYFDDAYRTDGMTVMFYVVQMAALWLSFAAHLALAWREPESSKTVHVLGFSLPLAAGPLLLIASMYVQELTPAFVAVAALLTGYGSAGYMASWQRVFAALDATHGTTALISGTAGSAVLYFCICLIPPALVAYLIPLVMVPLAGLCLWLAARQTSVAQPMFEDVPREHPVVYRNALRESLLPALSVGALGFCSGAVRFLALSHQDLQSAINLASMAVLLVIFVAFFLVWRTRTVSFDLMDVYRVLFPAVATCLVVLPFAGQGFTNACTACAYAGFMLATVLMMMHCAQISRDSGINPVFVYAFYAAITYAFQTLGYVIGAVSNGSQSLSVEQDSLVSLVALFVMLLVALFGRRTVKLHTDRLEFLTLSPRPERGNASVEIAIAEAARTRQERDADALEADDGAHAASGRSAGKRAGSGGGKLATQAGGEAEIADRVSKRCRQLAEHYGLSSRETEVMELLARGYTGPAIAEALFISENTMRTHSRRIYAKLGIHKKQELLVLLDQFEG